MPRYEDYRAKYDELQSYSAVARHFGVHKETVRESLVRGRQREAQSPGILDALDRTGLEVSDAKFGYRRVKDPETGSFNTVFWRMADVSPQDLAERLREALSDIPPAPQVNLTATPSTDLMTLLPIADAHIGLMAWARETGEDWDTRKGAERLSQWAMRTLAGLPSSSRLVVLVAGDLLHADDTRAETPASKHRLDVDTRHFRTLEVTIETLAHVIEYGLTLHNEVLLRVLPGNHDPHASIAVLLALAERYREHDRVHVQKDPSEFFIHQFGQVLIAAHHGHRAKAPQMVHFIADEYAPLWGKTKYRYLFTGHLHHHKSQDIGGMQWVQLPSITARDAYTVSNAYVARAQMQGMAYHREKGEIVRISVSD
jgi:hypothetical protein